MHIKKFTGATVKDAIRQIKAELGKGALILSSKRVASGQYETVAAVDYDLSKRAGLDISGGSYGSEDGPVSSDPSGVVSGGRKSHLSSITGGASHASDGGVEESREVRRLRKVIFAQSRTHAAEVFARLEEEFVLNGIDRRLARKLLMNNLQGEI